MGDYDLKTEAASLQALAIRIWNAGVRQVLGEVCTARHVTATDQSIQFGPIIIPTDRFSRLVVVGAGKGAGAMGRGLEQALGDDLLTAKETQGWINVPEGNVTRTRFIHQYPARPVGRNEPTPQALAGTQAIIDLVGNAAPDDLCVCLLSGGASALMVSPADGITLEDKQQVARVLSAAGANIRDLNTVRRVISKVKGGGLARMCRARYLITLVLSDVLGDPLDVIGSGPTFPSATTAFEARSVLQRLGVIGALPAVAKWLESHDQQMPLRQSASITTELHHLVIGNLADAMRAAATEAEQLGWSTTIMPIDTMQPSVAHEAASLARVMLDHADSQLPVCIISGGEPVIQLVDPSVRGRGGRNQQLALALGLTMSQQLRNDRRWVVLSAGTDGEDGPTDVAGAIWDHLSIRRTMSAGLDPIDSLARNDAYSHFERIGGLFATGPTGTNVCDLRVLLLSPATSPT